MPLLIEDGNRTPFRALTVRMPELDAGMRLISCYAERALEAKRRVATAADSCRRPQPEGRSGILQLKWHTGSSMRENIVVIAAFEAW